MLLEFVLAAVLTSAPPDWEARVVPVTTAVDFPVARGEINRNLPGFWRGTPAQVENYFHRHDEIMRILQYVESNSDRVVVQEYGQSWERRQLKVAIITSPRNHARLDEIRERNRRNARAEVAPDLNDMPTIVWAGYGVHGNEPSATEAGLAVLAHLAFAEGPEVEQFLDRVVVILDPNMNPDGRERFLNPVLQFQSRATLDPNHAGNRQIWPNGRSNHYLFDLNRDWMPAVHPESDGRLALWRSWMPQVSLDYHEMGGESTYFFQPGVPTRWNPFIPQGTIDLTYRIADFNARALDQVRELYWAEEGFDDYYPGKGSTYPDLQGSIGILYEQGSARGFAVSTSRGILTYAETVRNQIATSLGSLQAAYDLREDLIRHQYDFFREDMALGEAQSAAGLRLSVGPDMERFGRLQRFLRIHEIEYRLERGDPREYALVIPYAQPGYRFIRNLFDDFTEFADQGFYDVSAWTLNYAFGAERSEVNNLPPPVTTLPIEVRPAVTGDSILVPASPLAQGQLYEFLANGGRARLLTRDVVIEVDGERVEVPMGSWWIHVNDLDALPEAWRRSEPPVDLKAVYPLTTTRTLEGPDIGSNRFVEIALPRVAIVIGNGSNSLAAGEAWYVMEQIYDIPVSLIELFDRPTMDLSRYDVILYTGGRPTGAVLDNLTTWVSRGGTLIAWGGSAANVAGSALITLRGISAPSRNLDLTNVPFAELADERVGGSMPGSLFRLRLDVTHPVAYGMPDEVVAMRRSNSIFARHGTAGNTPGVYTSSPLMSGYVPEGFDRTLGGTASVVAARNGSGRVVLFFDEPMFRGFWFSTMPMVGNAIFNRQAF